MTNIRPVILCGGSGKRLWPLSRESYPKQFTHLVREDETMLQTSVRRLIDAGGRAPILITGNEHRFIVSEQMEKKQFRDREVLIEPVGRNTAPAVAAAAAHLEETDPDAIMIVSPADHHMQDEKAFAHALTVAVEAAKRGEIVTFGIVPDRAETGYGYIELKSKISEAGEISSFTRFVEKPKLADAEKMLAEKRFLWNSGIFVFSVPTIIQAFEEHAPEILAIARQSLREGQKDLDFFRLSEGFENAEEISIDHAVMEKVAGQVVPLDCGWNDLGGWRTIWLESEKDQFGNASKGSTTMLNCHYSMLRSEDPKIHMVGIGLKNIAAVAMRDSVLIADMDDAQAVSDAVNQMKAEQIEQAEIFPQSARPWGWFETLTKRSRFHVKSIVVKPNQKLSLQSHVHRAEHWIVVEGTARVTIDDSVKLVGENQSIYVPLGAVHRLENPGKVDLHLIEVQTGAYLEEDDIVRYEDIYARS